MLTRVSMCVHLGDVLRMSLTCFVFRFEAFRCPYDYSFNLSSYKNTQNENHQRKEQIKRHHHDCVLIYIINISFI